MSSDRKIPFFDYQALYKSKQSEILDVLTDVMKRGAYILQRDLAEFEENLKEFLDVKHAFGVADGTNALLLSLYAVGLESGDEVILPSHTYQRIVGHTRCDDCTSTHKSKFSNRNATDNSAIGAKSCSSFDQRIAIFIFSAYSGPRVIYIREHHAWPAENFIFQRHIVVNRNTILYFYIISNDDHVSNKDILTE